MIAHTISNGPEAVTRYPGAEWQPYNQEQPVVSLINVDDLDKESSRSGRVSASVGVDKGSFGFGSFGP